MNGEEFVEHYMAGSIYRLSNGWYQFRSVTTSNISAKNRGALKQKIDAHLRYLWLSSKLTTKGGKY